MSELRKDPTPQQLLERIVQLEIELSKLRMKELPKIRADYEDMRKGFLGMWDGILSEAKNVTAHLREIDDYLWPLVYRVFPGAGKDHAKIREIIGTPVPDADDKKT